jgi:phosphoserine phosphatase RsbU/P
MTDHSSGTTLSASDLHRLLAVTSALATPFDLRTMLAEVAAAARSVLHAERASVWLLDEARQELVIEVSSDLKQVRVLVGTGFVGQCAATRALINVPDCYADPRFNAEVDRRSGFHTRCILTLPLIDHHRVLVGVMQILNKAEGVFDATDEALGTALAAQCAVALTRVRMTEAAISAQRVRQELEIASTVQHSILPKHLPQVADYDMHGIFLPAEETGGDTYDLASIEQGLLIVLGDATGHGIAPALSVIQMHAMLRMAFRIGATLETAFCNVNDQLAATLPDCRFVTAFIGLLDPATHRLRFLSGGQGPILHLHAADGTCSTYRATSFPLGAMPIRRLKSPVEITLEPGDWLAVISDGVFEQSSPTGELFGQHRVEQLMALHRDGSAAGMGQQILESVTDFAQTLRQDDDITIVLVKRLG